MTTTPTHPFTVADLRRWAFEARRIAVDGFHKNGSELEYLAQAAAFDALADADEAVRTLTALSAGKATAHWLWVALSRVAAGEDVDQVMRDYGWERTK